MRAHKHLAKLQRLHALRQLKEVAAQAQLAISNSQLQTAETQLQAQKNHLSQIEASLPARKDLHFAEALKQKTLTAQLRTFEQGCRRDNQHHFEAIEETHSKQVNLQRARSSQQSAEAVRALHTRKRKASDLLLGAAISAARKRDARQDDENLESLPRLHNE